MITEEKKAYMKAYRAANKERLKAYDKTYRDANRDKDKARHKAYRLANKDSCRAYNVTVTLPYRSVVNCHEGYIVLHLNHDHTDNRRTNLLVMKQADHASYHAHIQHGNYDKASEIIYNYGDTQ